MSDYNPVTYITVKAAAEMKDVTPAALYNAIKGKELVEYLVDGKKMLSEAEVQAWTPRKYGNKERSAPSLETVLWLAADKLRGSMDAAEYKHVVLGLVFLRHTSEAFERRHAVLLAEAANPESDLYVKDEASRSYVAEERDEYSSEGIFWVPQEARWSFIASKARLPEIGEVIDGAMVALERENPSLTGVLPKDYARPALDKRRLGEMVDLIGNIGQDDAEGKGKRGDLIGWAYEYFLGRFASAEGKRGGEFYTPAPVVRLLVEMLQPFKGRIYDPCCGSGGMFVQSEKFLESHGGKLGDISVYGQEMNATTWKLAKMNLAIRHIENNLGPTHADTFHQDLHPDLKADFILANPPFNISDWGGEHLKDDKRWKYGIPPTGNANYAWIQHMVAHLSPKGKAGFVLANGSMSSNSGGEGEIRKALIEADLVDCIVALPGQLFFTTQIPVCLWFLSRKKKFPRETLFVDARKLGRMENRTLKTLDDADIEKIAKTYHAWQEDSEDYNNEPGFCFSATIEEMEKQGFVLTPGRYVGAAEEEVDENAEPFDAKMQRLAGKLTEQFAKSDQLEATIQENLRRMGYAK
ncbi:type I restriction enzyme M protein [Armatimonas rosea]|uniref:site-specific DNA-methyltransferase (adenine-specific) n=2 Tax=Armatimonas rosea TaxID=685828 RepID=A0A7W9SW40_ARMRO|nr:class I SAM-dependent DNA methyltransferase [Armatimonas rosea]MBB6053930.1 type I restriction enzyme M protein [Armatimonas rosea]